MRRLALTIIALFSFSALVSAQGFCIPVHSLQADSLAFAAGEKMYFSMHYEWGAINSDVGTAEVSLRNVRYNGTPAFHCHVHGRTTRLYDLFFKVREDFQSWFSADGLSPLKFTRDTEEGKYIAKNTYIYSPRDTVIYADVYSTSGGSKSITLPLDRCTFDLPALFYFARNMDMSSVVPEVRYPMTFAIDDDVYNVHFIMHGKETVKVRGLGVVKTVRFSARLLAGEIFKGDTDMTIWISDDDNRLPVLFEAPILVGKASGRLRNFSGLKHPFTSLIKDERK